MKRIKNSSYITDDPHNRGERATHSMDHIISEIDGFLRAKQLPSRLICSLLPSTNLNDGDVFFRFNSSLLH